MCLSNQGGTQELASRLEQEFHLLLNIYHLQKNLSNRLFNERIFKKLTIKIIFPQIKKKTHNLATQEQQQTFGNK